MKRYSVQMVRDGRAKYYYIQDSENYEIVPWASKYLMHKVRSGKSPNTIRREAFAVCSYFEYLHDKQLTLEDVGKLNFEKQYEHFVAFLHCLKRGEHRAEEEKQKPIANATCNAYLKAVFRFFNYLEMESGQGQMLKVLSYNYEYSHNSVGVRRTIQWRSFKGYLKEKENKPRAAEQDEIITILEACTNCRDQLLILLMAETGFRIGEILGVNYCKDIDYTRHTIKACFRDDNENDARAKNAEYREAKISDDTFEFLLCYLSEYRDLLQNQSYLFVNIEGKTAGKALKVESVYDMLDRMEKKTSIKLTPHMLRRYFANMRRKAGWGLELIQQAIGHKNIQTTIRYLNIQDDELLQASETFYRQHSALYPVEQLL